MRDDYDAGCPVVAGQPFQTWWTAADPTTVQIEPLDRDNVKNAGNVTYCRTCGNRARLCDCLMITHAVCSTLVLSTVVTLSLVLLPGLTGCGAADSAPPVATPEVVLSRSSVSLGGPLDMHYRFTVAPDVTALPDDYRVFVHFLDADGALMFTDDHEPPQPTGTWRPGQEITYERRMIVPVYPYIGEVTVAVGLYAPLVEDRLPLAGRHLGGRAYQVGTLDMVPQFESGFATYVDGWHGVESGSGREWRWTTGLATISFRNPRTDATLHLEVGGRSVLLETPQRLTLEIGETAIEALDLETGASTYHRIDLPAERLGDNDAVVLTLNVDATFVPAEMTGNESPDQRELGVQVLYAFLEEHEER